MSSTTPEYDVFLSFRREDTGRTFVSHLLHSLAEKGISVFENETLTVSESTRLAIRSSKTAVVVVSENYASSPCCLEELEHIMTYHERIGPFAILPVYYGVDPSDVRRQTGKFGEQFLEQRRENPNKLKSWRVVLTELANNNIIGMESENWDDEAVLIQKITDVTWEKLSASNSCGLVGMDLHMATMDKLLALGDIHEVREIGICGLGGIGKTTLARYVYRQISHFFDVHFILDDVPKTHQELQSKLTQASESTNMISHDGIPGFTSQNRVLLLVDGVETIKQIVTLRKEYKQLLGPGSRVIFTCQDKHLYNACGIKHMYQVEPMAFSEARKLFSSCAFRQSHPPSLFNLSVRAVKLADGLPFMVAAVGSELFGRSKEEWEPVLSRYERSFNEDTIGIEKSIFDETLSIANTLPFSRLYPELFLGERQKEKKPLSPPPGIQIPLPLRWPSHPEWESRRLGSRKRLDEVTLEADESSLGVSVVSKVPRGSMERWKLIRSALIGTSKSGFGVSDDENRSMTGKIPKFNYVGMDRRIQAVCGGLMKMRSDKEIRIVGISGVGGVGKTTVARCVYEETMPHFHTHSFLENVGKIYQDHGSLHLQEDALLENIQRSSKNGSEVTKAGLRNRKVLLVVDGVENAEQVEDVKKVATWFGAGSRVIMTTRDENLLVDNGVKHVHELKCLKVHEALQLFYQFAFKQQTRSSRFKQLSLRAVQLSGRIPLALEVLASFLQGKSGNDWESVLQKLERQDNGEESDDKDSDAN